MNKDLTIMHTMTHECYTDLDPNPPKHLLDNCGSVVLSQCKLCGDVEIELRGPCKGKSFYARMSDSSKFDAQIVQEVLSSGSTLEEGWDQARDTLVRMLDTQQGFGVKVFARRALILKLAGM